MEEGDVEEEGMRVVSVRPTSRVRLEQQHPVQADAKGVHHLHDAFQANNGAGVYGASAAGYAYGHALRSSYSSTGSVGYSPGYGIGSYGARRSGMEMKREEDEMTVSFSVREEDEGGDGSESGRRRKGWWWSGERRWDGDRDGG